MLLHHRKHKFTYQIISKHILHDTGEYVENSGFLGESNEIDGLMYSLPKREGIPGYKSWAENGKGQLLQFNVDKNTFENLLPLLEFST